MAEIICRVFLVWVAGIVMGVAIGSLVIKFAVADGELDCQRDQGWIECWNPSERGGP